MSVVSENVGAEPPPLKNNRACWHTCSDCKFPIKPGRMFTVTPRGPQCVPCWIIADRDRSQTRPAPEGISR